MSNYDQIEQHFWVFPFQSELEFVKLFVYPQNGNTNFNCTL